LERLGFAAFEVRINHRELLTGLLSAAGVPPALHDVALVGIDKLDKIGPDGVRAELAGRGIAESAAAECLALFGAKSAGDLRGRLASEERALYAIEQLESIAEMSRGTPAGAHLKFDPSLARGLSYYTGTIMEIAVPDLAGSLGGGGRYDKLVGMFL